VLVDRRQLGGELLVEELDNPIVTTHLLTVACRTRQGLPTRAAQPLARGGTRVLHSGRTASEAHSSDDDGSAQRRERARLATRAEHAPDAVLAHPATGAGAGGPGYLREGGRAVVNRRAYLIAGHGTADTSEHALGAPPWWATLVRLP